ncbi:MAG: ATP-grasp domain-containing protein [Chloroflexi bacterium]|nr:ATP-grasp domain-containing protein [Chloroflexota bacterium]
MRTTMQILMLLSEMPGLTDEKTVDNEVGRDVFITADAIDAALRERGHRVTRALIQKSVLDALESYDPRAWAVFNLCETLEGESFREPYVPAVLDALGYAYTGSDARALHACVNKAKTKARLAAAGLPTAAYQLFRSPDDPVNVPFPAFVKPVAEDASYGVTDNAVVRNKRELRRQVSTILSEFGGPVLVEDFIAGREFNVGIIGNDPPRALPLAEINFARISDPHRQIISFAAKWDDTAEEFHDTPVTCPADVSPLLAAEIQRVSLEAFRLMGCRDYGRVDIRVRDNQPYILEVNPNCGIAPDAGFPREMRIAGFDYGAMAEQIARLADERRAARYGAAPVRTPLKAVRRRTPVPA